MGGLQTDADGAGIAIVCTNATKELKYTYTRYECNSMVLRIQQHYETPNMSPEGGLKDEKIHTIVVPDISSIP